MFFVSCQDNAKIVALSNYWQKNESPGPYCGRKVKITNQGGGQNNNGQGNVVIATVADTCPSCGENDLGIQNRIAQQIGIPANWIPTC